MKLARNLQDANLHVGMEVGLGRRAVGAANSATAPPTIWSLIWFLRRRLQNKEGPHTKAAAVITIDYVPNPIHIALPDRHRPAPTIAPNPPSFLAEFWPSPDHFMAPKGGAEGPHMGENMERTQ